MKNSAAGPKGYAARFFYLKSGRLLKKLSFIKYC